MKKKIKMGIGDLNKSGQRFAETWHKVEGGKPVELQEWLTFDDLETLLRVLTPARWTLLRSLRREGPLSVRKLSKALSRDYKNVYTDVRELERAGLVTKVKDGRVMVPWDTLVAEVQLEAA
jgi:predicted transcriptional regulator